MQPASVFLLESPTDRGAWQAPVHRVTRSRTRLKRQHACTQEEKPVSRQHGWPVDPRWRSGQHVVYSSHLARRETPLSPIPIRAKEWLFTACQTETGCLQSLLGRTGFCGTSAVLLVHFPPLHQLQVSSPAPQTLTGSSQRLISLATKSLAAQL